MEYEGQGSIRSLGDLLRQSCDRWGEKTAIRHHIGGKIEDISFKRLLDLSFEFAKAFDAEGLKRGDRCSIFSENCLEWAVADWAAQTLGIVTVPIYPTLPADQAEYIVRDSASKLVLVGSPELDERIKSSSSVRTIALCGESGLAASAKNSKLSRESWIEGISAIEPEETATIIYTSGTTGQPKGAVLPHRAFIHLSIAILDTLPINDKDTFLSFLPISHVYERFAGHVLPIAVGATIAYAQSLATLAKDMTTFKPTVMLCVPRFLEATMNKIVDGAEKLPGLRRKLFHLAWQQGTAKHHRRFAPLSPLLDKIVASKIRERTGGRIRFFVSGGGALPKHVADFYFAFGLPILQGYGLTETCAATCVNHPDHNRPETVGEPIRGVSVKIAGDGEILIRGPSVMTGYHNLPDATAEAIDADGWFHSGDIGLFDGPYLRITDRKKDILVLGNGKNVAPQPIENKLRESALIGEAVLFGDGMQYVCAMIVPDLERVQALAAEHGVKSENIDEILKLDAIRSAIKGHIDQVNRGLADFEKVKRHEIVNAKFSVESGELTPSMKVKRKVVKERYADVIRRMDRD